MTCSQSCMASIQVRFGEWLWKEKQPRLPPSTQPVGQVGEAVLEVANGVVVVGAAEVMIIRTIYLLDCVVEGNL